MAKFTRYFFFFWEQVINSHFKFGSGAKLIQISDDKESLVVYIKLEISTCIVIIWLTEQSGGRLSWRNACGPTAGGAFRSSSNLEMCIDKTVKVFNLV